MSAGQQNRSARLELRDRLELAQHAAALLQSKEEVLQRERARLSGHEDRSRRRWEQTCEHANACLLRARALGASDAIGSLITRGPNPASMVPDWKVSMGVSYPGEVVCAAADQADLTGTAALLPAIDAYREALESAAQLAASATARKRIDRELSSTRRRRRAISDHLVPTIAAELHRLELALDEQDREEAVRIRLAVDARHASRQETRQ